MSTRKNHYRVAVVAALFAIGFVVLRATSAVSADAPTSGFLADYLGQLDYVQKEIMALEQAIPQEKFTWRPAEGVRSIGEVYAHIAFGNYIILNNAGIKPPADVNLKGGEKGDGATTDKAKIAEMLKKSFEHARAAATKVSEADLDKMVNMFGRQVTVRNVFITVLDHLHEHLGQSIAYARMNGVVPPWTAERQARQAGKEKQTK